MRTHLLAAPLLALLTPLTVLSACGSKPALVAQDATQLDARTIVGPRSYLDGWPALAGDRNVHVVVEIPAGTLQKWEVEKPSGKLVWERKDGKPRVVRFAGYPGNYGMIPRTLLAKKDGGDGDPLDVLVLGPQRPRGAVLKARPIGVIRLLDRGEKDDKILAVDTEGPFAQVRTLAGLRTDRPGLAEHVGSFFAAYKGPGKLQVLGIEDEAAAWAIVKMAIATAAKQGVGPQHFTL